MPPIFWMSSVASSWTTSTMSSTVTMPFMRPSSSTTGHREEAGVSAKSRLSASWSMSLGDGDDVGVHDLRDRLVGRRGEQLAERDHAEQVLLRVEHVDVVDRLEPLARLAPQVADRLVDASSPGARARSAGSSGRRRRPRRRRAAPSPRGGSARRAGRAVRRAPRAAPAARRRRRRRAAAGASTTAAAPAARRG